MADGMQQISNGVKMVGEALLPGTSLLMDGRVKEGAAHTIVGLAARTLLGPVGWGIVAVNSFSKSVSDQSIIDLAGGLAGDARNAFKRDASPAEDSKKK